jgi:uncharacterized protein
VDASNLNAWLAIACLLAGIGIGALAYHWLNAGAGHRQKLRQRLAERDRELTALKGRLADHFTETLDLAERLRQDSAALAERLEHDAGLVDGAARAERSLDMDLAAEQSAANETFDAPRDYADGTGGTLSEDFGLKDDGDATPQVPRY